MKEPHLVPRLPRTQNLYDWASPRSGACDIPRLPRLQSALPDPRPVVQGVLGSSLEREPRRQRWEMGSGIW